MGKYELRIKSRDTWKSTEGGKPEKKSNMHKTQICIILLSFFFCSCLQAPRDYYYQFALIERWGAKRREKTQRKVTDVVVHPEQTKPLIVAFFPEEKDTGFKGIVPITKPDPSQIEKPETLAKSKVPVAITQDILTLTLNQAGIDVVAIRIVNGRLEDKENLVRVNFVPKALSYDSIYKQFLKLCAVIEVIQAKKGTVDKVNAIIEKDDMPYMMLESSIENYKAYMNEKISLEEWISHLEITKF